ncbi:hypothetical protein F3J40_16015 [Pantoea sp. Acro-835]|uniref:Type I addiction module toxin, SymE family n=1 Tax=Candidatus Pantoea multigeneris TaxID=2608357 RepID=A0ABX0RIM9_9GAMM|nr:hypothetical protein [Pantoea multigeneris]
MSCSLLCDVTGFCGRVETGRGVIVKISGGCIVLMAGNNEIQELREQIYQVKQVIKVGRIKIFPAFSHRY